MVIDYKKLFNSCLRYSDDLFLVLSPDLIVKEINFAIERILGWKKDEVCNKKISAIFDLGLTQPFIDLKNPTSPDQQITYVLNKERILKVTWEIVPIYNSNKKCESIFVIGKYETAVTDEQLNVLPLENVVKYAPGFFYWKDKDSVYQGCNDEFARFAGLESRLQVRGKTDFDLAWKEKAELYVEIDKKVISTGKAVLNHEEIITVANNKIIIAITNKVPLLDNKNHIIGVMGITTDITHQKHVEHALSVAKEQAEIAIKAMKDKEFEEKVRIAEAEHLKLENAAHKAQLEAQALFTKTVNQVVHDIRSPLATLLMLVQYCKEIPERERVDLQRAGKQIAGIAADLLNQYKSNETIKAEQEAAKHPLLLSTTLLDLVSEKSYQYRNLPIQFDPDISKEGLFSFIHAHLFSFKRLISNLINNAVDAFEGKPGCVMLKLDVADDVVKIIVQDNGKGMSPALVKKIEKNIVFTAGKKNGHGLGLAQVREALHQNEGFMKIDAVIGEGTLITLTFPRVTSPLWCAAEMQLNIDDIVVILDDDPSIHGAWDSRFKEILVQAPSIQIHHFSQGQEALDFMLSLSEEEKERIFLLTDYELLQQNLNGLDVVKKTKVKRSLLVTSHYANPQLSEEAISLGTKILPKQLAAEIEINLNKPSEELASLKAIDLILVDDDVDFVSTLCRYPLRDKTVDAYHALEQLKDNLAQYAFDTPIILDNHYNATSVTGVEFAKTLHKLGYTKIYLLSGDSFELNEIPDYITVICKSDIEEIKNL